MGQDVGLGSSFATNQSGLVPQGLFPKAIGFGFYSVATLQAGATDWFALQACQFGAGVQAGASSEAVICVRIGHQPGSAVPGTGYESALDFVDDIATVTGWDALITSTDVGGKYPLASDGTFIRTLQGAAARRRLPTASTSQTQTSPICSCRGRASSA